MITVRMIFVGSFKEAYWRDAAAEYEKRLLGLCRFESVCLKEERLPENPSQKQIEAALAAEGDAILAAIPRRAYKIAMCVEGKEMSSEALAERIGRISESTDTICFVIGSSYGLSEKVKQACDLRLSVSQMTFPHQLLRVMLLEIVYRSFQILRGSRYHK